MYDILDKSMMRKGRPCWYRLEDIQMSAINDSFMIGSGVYKILKENFSHLDCCVKLYELFHEISLITSLGQFLDTKPTHQDVLSFTMEQYKTVVVNKAYYYSFHLPVVAAMYLAGYTDPDTIRQTKNILLESGNFSQIQDDFLDCFGDSEVTGKIGSDIKNSKCTWLAVICLQRATPAQKEIMRECYGKNDPKAIARVKQLYRDLSLPEIYTTYKKDYYNKIERQIQQSTKDIPMKIFLKTMENFKRKMIFKDI